MVSIFRILKLIIVYYKQRLESLLEVRAHPPPPQEFLSGLHKTCMYIRKKCLNIEDVTTVVVTQLRLKPKVR